MKQWLYAGELAEIGGIFRDTILDFKSEVFVMSKKWNSEYLELLERTKDTQCYCE